jgi:hypothetical protein
MAAPTYTGGSAGNAKSSAALAASGTATFDVDVSTSVEGRLQVGATGGGTVAATNGLKVEVFEMVGSTAVADTVAGPGSITLAMAVSTLSAASIHLQTGKYRIKYTNLDSTNALANAYATLDLTPSFA